MGAREHAVLTMFLGVCFLHPVPMPGVSAVLGTIIAVAGGRIALVLVSAAALRRRPVLLYVGLAAVAANVVLFSALIAGAVAAGLRAFR